MSSPSDSVATPTEIATPRNMSPSTHPSDSQYDPDGGSDSDAGAPKKTANQRARKAPSTPATPVSSRKRKAPASGSGSASVDDTPSKKGKKWSAVELEQLFNAALAGGPKQTDFAGKVPGRSPKMCHDTWKKTIKPFILARLKEKGKAAVPDEK